MRLLVISDTHGSADEAERALQMAGEVDMVIHAGDHLSDGTWLQRRTGIPVIGVLGNRDYALRGPSEEIFDAGGLRIYVTHGHEFAVKSRMAALEKRARELGADVVVYGHTHVPDLQWRDGRLYINPGSLYRPRGDSGRTFAILEIRGHTPVVKFMHMDS